MAKGQLARVFCSGDNPDLDVWKINHVTQLTLDRLVFVRVCEDRSIEPEQILWPLIASDPQPYQAFIQAIGPLRASYNGGLLDPDLAEQA